MPHLRAWRDSLKLSRQVVVDRMAIIGPGDSPIDQATLAKWEDGETAVRVEDLYLLAQVYGVTPDRLFFPPGDRRTPEHIQRAFKVITSADPDLVDGWLRTGEGLRFRDPDEEMEPPETS
jgi:transcriptional regulator with XRE-family HTH domain